MEAPPMLYMFVNLLTLQGKVTAKLREFIAKEAGATAIEYGLIVSLIAVVTIGVITQIGTSMNTKFQSLAAGLH
jgi:pilus assembly protein Flp/PilA